MDTLAVDIRIALNRASRENESNTPDHVLATYLLSCLEAFEAATEARDSFYGIAPRPGHSKARIV